MKYDLISIGSVVKDIIVLTDRGKIFKTPHDKLAPEWLGFELGEKLRTDAIEESLGGVATDLAVGTKKLGLNSSIISTIGTDYEWIEKELKKNKINTSFITVDKKRQTASVILVDKKTGERVILYNKSSGTINMENLNKIKTKWLSVSSLTGKWDRQANQIVKYVAENKTSLILLPSTSQIRDDFGDLKKLLKAATISILNRNEALEAASKAKAKTKNTKELFGFLHRLGPEIVCITDGVKGAHCSDGKKIYFSPRKKVKAVDVTGAGDAFASGFMGVFLKGVGDAYMRPKKQKAAHTQLLLEKSLKAGILNSASVVQYIGTTKGLIARKEIEKLI